MSDDPPQQARECFTFMRSYRDASQEMSLRERQAFYDAIIDFALDGKEPTLKTKNLRLAWKLALPVLNKGWKCSKAGRAGGEAGKGKARNSGNQNASKSIAKQKQINSETIAKQKQINSETIADKERKGMDKDKDKEVGNGEKTQKKEFAPHVHLTEAEHADFVAKHGKPCIDWCIDKLDSYKESSGKTYKSDAGAIRQWVLTAYQKEHPETTTRTSDDVIADRERKIDESLEQMQRNHPEMEVL